jgi:hypothetical protein
MTNNLISFMLQHLVFGEKTKVKYANFEEELIDSRPFNDKKWETEWWISWGSLSTYRVRVAMIYCTGEQDEQSFVDFWKNRR